MKHILLATCFFITACQSFWHDGYHAVLDLGTVCEKFPLEESDSSMQTNLDVLQLTANPTKDAGKYVGAIAAHSFPFQDNSTYTLIGEFRKASGEIEQIDANIQWVDKNYREHRAEILWSLNPESPLYGWVWTRSITDEEILLYKLGDDYNWHAFQIVAYHSGDTHLIKSLTIDDHVFEVNLPQGELDKFYNNRLTILLEVQNMYTGCNPLFNFTGTAEFRNVELITVVD